MTDQKADTARGPAVAVDPGAGTSAEKSFENEGGGNQAPAAPVRPSLIGKVEHAAKALRNMFTEAGRPR